MTLIDSNHKTWTRNELLQKSIDCAVEASRTGTRDPALLLALAQTSVAFTKLAQELREADAAPTEDTEVQPTHRSSERRDTQT